MGPTASGKTSVAQWLAEKDGYDILSTDSMLVYRGMDVGTAKPTVTERKNVSYHGIHLVDPDADFCLADYMCHARAALRTCAREGRRVILVGGTGLYIKALLSGFDELPPPCQEGRQQWEALWREEGIQALTVRIKALAPNIWIRLRIRPTRVGLFAPWSVPKPG